MVQLREADSHALIHVDIKVHQGKRSLPQPIDMGTDIIFTNGLGACGLDLLPLGGPDGQSALCKALAGAAQRARVGGVVGQAKLYAKRLSDAQTRATLHLDARQAVVIDERRLGAAYAEHAIALPHRALRRKQQVAVAIGIHLGDGIGEMAFVRPKLEHVARDDGALACHGGLSVLDGRHTSDEHAAVVRTTVAHDLISALALQIRSGEASGERLGKLGVLLLRASRSGPILHAAFTCGIARRENAVERGAISAGHSIDILRRLHTALDFQGRHAGAYQIGKQIDAAQILRGQQVVARCRERLVLRHVMQCVRQAARLRAQAAIGRAPADERGHEALARIAHAQRTMGERLDFQAQLVADLR